MLRVIERLGQWPAQQFTSLFSSSLSECKQLFDDKRPGFSILSLGLYLERREKYDLIPLVRPRINGESSERYRVMAQPGKFDGIDALKGKSLGGTPLDDADFVSRIVFEGRYPVLSFFEPKPTRMALKSIRAVAKGELDAVLLNQQQYDALPALKLNSPLAVIYESDAIPLIGVVADKTRTQPQERERFAKAMNSLCADAEGARLCALFGVDAFVGVEPSIYSEVIKRWNPNNKAAGQ
ncbi:phosphate/phosphite/phosphonate ABC transporter substrate-binding protein [Candidatus Methylospira mobilis]|uniref:Phosphate/phosphite/phosphonate ABC transporter substrate-binding protein n=2 Tax=Candidatus Methylospira mobilis TaxID=1808979 RepID=A0A5Q0BMD1_9GAMM|nr:phosphate/phosphite/phosphonate ABC transporter substrate-binding protein [Candidatus Methylospira mobilis]